MFTGRSARIVATIVSAVALNFCLASAGLSQTRSDNAVTSEGDKTPEEIIVYGKTNIIILRNALYRAQENFFDLYNSLNSHPQFDVECKKRQKSISERRKEHRCAPSFALEYEAWVAARFMRGMGRGYAGMLDPAFVNLEYQALVRAKEKEMWAEIAELIETNPEFQDEIKELFRANRALEDEKERRGPCPKLFCRK
jgi:hypothetical protein